MALVITGALLIGSVPALQTVLFTDGASAEDELTAGTSGQADLTEAQAAASQGEHPLSDQDPSNTGSSADVPRRASLDPIDYDAYPNEMFDELVGPSLVELKPVELGMPLSEAIAQHPAFQDAPPLPVLPGYLSEALSQVLQAHGSLTQLMELANDDPLAAQLVPYAAARLATVARTNAPAFQSAASMNTLADTELQLLPGQSQAVVSEDLDRELQHLSELLGLPRLPANLPADVPEHALASIVAATNQVIATTQLAQSLAPLLPSVEEEFAKALATVDKGFMSESEARQIQRAADLAHQVMLEPLQARVDAVHALSATAEAFGPLAAPAATSTPLAVDPLGLIVIMGDGDDNIDGDDVPPNSELGQPVGPLFPDGSLVIIDTGGNDTYKNVAHANGTKRILHARGPGAGVSEVTDPIDEETDGGISTGNFLVDVFTEVFLEIAGDSVGREGRRADNFTDIEATLAVPQPASIVIDLDGDDTYRGDRVAYAAGGATAGIIDLNGSDDYRTTDGLGLVELDGYGFLFDARGDDRYRAENGMGAVMPKTGEQLPMNLPSLAAFVDTLGDDTYRLDDFGHGTAFYNSTLFSVADSSGGLTGTPSIYRAHATALDLDGRAEGFTPIAGGERLDPSVSFEEDGKGAARYWEQVMVPTGSGASNADCEDETQSNECSFAGEVFRTHFFTVQALQRGYFANTTELSNGTITVSNMTAEARPSVSILELGSGSIFGFRLPEGFQDLELPGLLEMALTDRNDIHDGLFPAILIDAAGDDTYINATPTNLFVDITESSSASSTQSLPMLVLDASGDDTYLGDTAHVRADTTNVHERQLVAAGVAAVVADIQGDDHYMGNVSSVTFNATVPMTADRLTLLVYDANGTDRYDTGDGQMAGVRLEETIDPGDLGNSQQAMPDYTTAVLLDGGRGRNTFQTGQGSLGGVVLDVRTGDTNGAVFQDGRIIAGAVVTSGSDYTVGPASLGAIDWRSCVENAQGGCDDVGESNRALVQPPFIQGLLPGASVAALFLGSQGSDTYRIHDLPGPGEVITGDSDGDGVEDACQQFDPTTVNNLPYWITRFIDLGGSDTYELSRTDIDVRAWGNDNDWNGIECEDGGVDETLKRCDNELSTNAVHPSINDSALRAARNVFCSGNWVGGLATVIALLSFTEATAETLDDQGVPYVIGEAYPLARQLLNDLPAASTIERRWADAQGIDNVLPWATTPVGTVSETADRSLESFVDLLSAEICTGQPRSFAESDGKALVVDGMSCGTGPTLDEKMHISLRSELEVPVNLLDTLDPCDIGRASDEGGQNASLGLEIHDSNVPRGNPLAQGLSGCWAVLELHVNSTETSKFHDIGPSPIWEPRIPNATRDTVVLEGPVICTIVDDGGNSGILSVVPVEGIACSTDAFPTPHHVDGTGGHEAGRVLLPEGDYRYNLTFHGALETLLGANAEVDGTLRVDYETPFGDPVRPSLPDPIGTWIESHDDNTTELPTYLDGIWVRAKSQSSTSRPQAVEVWSPMQLNHVPHVYPVLAHKGTVYSAADDRISDVSWNDDLGLWMTTYRLVEDDELAPLFGFTPGSSTLPLAEGPNEVELWLVFDRGFEFRVLDIPQQRIADTLIVDDESPELSISPGKPQIDRVTAGYAQLACPGSFEKLFEAVTSPGRIDCLRFELPINVTDDSPIRSMTVAGLDDSIRGPLPVGPDGDPITVLLPPNDDRVREELTCNTEPLDEAACLVELNRTYAGPSQDGTGWERRATLNVTFNLDSSDAGDIDRAAGRLVTGDEEARLVVPGGVRTVDDARRVASSGLGSIRINLAPPEDLVLTCGGAGTSLITNATTADLLYQELSDDVLGLFIETRLLGEQSWERAPGAYHELDDLEEVDQDCESDDRSDWKRLTVDIQELRGLGEDEQAVVQVRTVALDETGNEELSRSAFDAVITYDLRAPEINVTQTRSAPHGATLEITADEPVRIVDAELQLTPERVRGPTQLLPSAFTDEHHLSFTRLKANQTYPVTLEIIDLAGHRVTQSVNVTAARTLNVTLEPVAEVSGDQALFTWLAGAMPTVEGGDPSTLVTLEARADGTPCASRSIPSFISAPMDDPSSHEATLSILDCPAGNLTLHATFTTGLETVALATRTIHDTRAPVPGHVVEGELSSTGWYTSKVRIKPTATDDASETTAHILHDGHKLKALTLSQPGVHTIQVQATDAVGRNATRTFEVPVDLDPPSVELIPEDPLPVKRPMLDLRVASTDDASGLRSIRTQAANGSWTPWFPVIQGITMPVDVRGIDVLVAEGIDRAGHTTRVTLPLRSALEAPEVLGERITAEGPGTIQATVDLDRSAPLVATALTGDQVLAKASSEAAETHTLTLTGLPPGQEVTVEIAAQLATGSQHTLIERAIQLPDDAAPPTPPKAVETKVNDDGTVLIQWAPADDDGGIGHYVVERSNTEGTTTQITNETQVLDDPTPGLAHAYRVQAVDLSGKQSVWSPATTVDGELATRLAHYSFDPRIADEGDPVTVRTVIQASQRPGSVSIEIGDATHELHLESGGEGRWLYQASIPFPTTDLFDPADVRFLVDGQAYPDEGTLPGPIVQAAALDADSGLLPVPTLSAPLAILLTLLGAVLARRRWEP